MPTPEQEKSILGEQQSRRLSFEDRLRDLMEVEVYENGHASGFPAIDNPKLRRLGEMALLSRNQTIERLGKLLVKGDEWYLEGEVPEDEWSALAGVLIEKQEALAGEQEVALNISGISEQQRQLFETSRRWPPEKEREHWVDVEWDQEIYTRFVPTMEPMFYQELPFEERRDWDARWQLARAAHWKKVHYASPKELAEDLDWIQLTNTVEQTERLYNIEGVKQSLEWYADEIVNGTTKIADEGSGEEEEFCLVECESEAEFNEFREKLRDYLTRSVFGISEEAESQMSEEERQELRIKVKGADAIAWNWIWCSNLIESVDSRYSLQGPRRLRRRHAWLPALCSEALRTVYHPQERFEDECANGFEWGAFGKWGMIQLERIKKRFNVEREDIIFRAAESPRNFWQAIETKEGEVIVSVPECYPTTSMKSFWETYSDDSQGKVSLLERLLRKEKIDWDRVQSDLLEKDHFFLISKKAAGLLEYFNPGKPAELSRLRDWTDPLIDILNRLGLFNNEKLKSWAIYASKSGVVSVNKKRPPGINNFVWTFDLSSLFKNLRRRDTRYFLQGEKFGV